MTLQPLKMRIQSWQERRLRQSLAHRDAASQICQTLNGQGFQAYIVGGFVRDILSGKAASGDIDLATDARPEVVQGWAKKNHIKFSIQGLPFGAIKLYLGPSPIVVTTFRREKLNGENLSISFTKKLSEDAARRDFTINAIYADWQGKIHDPVGGLSDLEVRIVRFIGDPETRIQEDAFRILRYFRIRAGFANLNIPTEFNTLMSIKKFAKDVGKISRQRKGQELLKLLAEREVYSVLMEIQECDLLPHCLPHAAIHRIRVLEQFENEWQTPPDPLRRLAVLGINKPKTFFQLDRRSALRLDQLEHWIQNPAQPSELAYRLGSEAAVDIVLARAAIDGEKMASNGHRLIEHASQQRFPIRAVDLLPRFKGRELGNVLQQLETDWLDSDFMLSRRELLERASNETK